MSQPYSERSASCMCFCLVAKAFASSSNDAEAFFRASCSSPDGVSFASSLHAAAMDSSIPELKLNCFFVALLLELVGGLRDFMRQLL